MRQRGAVAILVAVAMVAMLGFLGLAVDGGHLYLTKTELQNSADACSLAASYELTSPTTLTPAAYSRAVAAGQTVALRNLVNFQGSAIVASNVSVSFSTDLKPGTSWVTASAAGSATPRPSYVRCTLTRSGIAMFFMPLLGFGSQSVVSAATAGLVTSQSSCVVPVGLCTVGGATTAPFGLTVSNWYSSGTSTFFNGGTTDWLWIGFSGNTSETVLDTLLAGNGACSVTVGQTVGKVSAFSQSTAGAWNSRFGLYQSGTNTFFQGGTTTFSVSSTPPDFTGYAYNFPNPSANWTKNTSALADFMTKRTSYAPYGTTVSAGNSVTKLYIGSASSYTVATSPGDYQQYGANRRLVITPIIDCSPLSNNNKTTPVLGWGCVLLLQPINQMSDATYVEYEGLANAAGSPCAGSGIPGGSTSAGPMVPALVQ